MCILIAIFGEPIAKKYQIHPQGMFAIIIVFLLPLGVIMGLVLEAFLQQEKKIALYQVPQDKLEDWQERLESYAPFKARIQHGIPMSPFHPEQEVTVRGVVWLDESEGIMVDCYQNDIQGDYPLKYLSVPENSEVFQHIAIYKRESGIYS